MFLDIGLVDLILKIDGLTLSPEVRNEKNTRNSDGVRFDGCVVGDSGLLSEQGRGDSFGQRSEIRDGIDLIR